VGFGFFKNKEARKVEQLGGSLESYDNFHRLQRLVERKQSPLLSQVHLLSRAEPGSFRFARRRVFAARAQRDRA
jgi:hypothetical protein